jgi:hypothetical protein
MCSSIEYLKQEFLYYFAIFPRIKRIKYIPLVLENVLIT